MLEARPHDLVGHFPPLQVETGAFGVEPLRRHGVDVALAQDDVVLAPDLDLVSVLGAEQHTIGHFHRAHVRTDRDHLGPGEALAELRSRRDEDAARGTPLAVGPVDLHEDAIGEHLDGETIVRGHGRKRYRVAPMSDDLNPAVGSITSRDGTVLEALLHLPHGDHAPRAVAAVAHPHPQFGGDMHNNVVGALCQGLAAAGGATVRFNFRGVGASSGAHGGGRAERDDFAAALDAAARLDADAPLYACGYSFGADVALTCTHERLAAWIVVAPPLRVFADDAYVAALDARPKHILAGAHDQFAAPDMVRAATAGWRNVIVHGVDMADHFFAGTTARVADLVTQIVTGER